MQKQVLFAFVLATVIVACAADCYLHAARGSNNKLMDQNDDTQNQNRLFDSQNNAAGGYMWGDTMTYYSGSLLQIEWTNQHGCGPNHPNVDCNFVLQYMCGPWIRDGSEQNTPNTIGTDNGGTDVTYDTDDSLTSGIRGQQEPLGWYVACRTRNRNGGLFLADNNIGTSAVNTRQNNNGNRHGFECPEERDYYPYWTPTPWKDIAVLTSKTSRCSYYTSNSQNNNNKGLCITSGAPVPKQDWTNTMNIPDIWDNQASNWDQASCVKNGNQWVVIKSWGLPAPDCYAPEFSRDNHLGNVYISGAVMTNTYKWVIPSVPYDQNQKYSTCVFRIRYNISSGDYNGFAEVDNKKAHMIDSTFNGKSNSPVTTNPTITFGYDSQGNARNLTLTIDTDQFGRTFQDRTHSFLVASRPSNIPVGARIYNLGVRGRRGNIVQCYPAVEYDFTPNHLVVSQTDYIHFQWTGSDFNQAGNAGQGLDQTDRSNMIPLKKGSWARANYNDLITNVKVFSQSFAYRLAHLDQPPICTSAGQTGCCKPDSQLTGNNQQDPQNCKYLNQASRLFNGGAVQPSSTGTFYFMSTRNNNFTNRSQKMIITVSTLLSPVALTGIAIGSAGFIGAAVVGGGVWYSQTHPTSAAANVFGAIKI